MEWVEIVPNVYRYSLLEKEVLPYSVNIHLVKGQEEALLVDCGYESEKFQEAILKGLEYIGIAPSKTKLFVTHIHIDHCGNADFCCELGMEILLSGVERQVSGKSTRISALTAKLCGVGERNFAEYELRTIQESKPIPGSRLPYKMLDKNIAYTPIYAGDTVRMGNYNFIVSEFKGHSPCHLCLFDENSGIVFSGDMLVLGTIPVVLASDLEQSMLAHYLQGISKLKQWDSEIFCTGHGEALRKKFGEPELAVEMIYNDYNNLLNKLCSWLSESAERQTVVQIAARLYKCSAASYLDNRHDAKTVMLMKIFACLEHLCEQGRINKEVEQGVVYYFC